VWVDALTGCRPACCRAECNNAFGWLGDERICGGELMTAGRQAYAQRILQQRSALLDGSMTFGAVLGVIVGSRLGQANIPSSWRFVPTACVPFDGGCRAMLEIASRRVQSNCISVRLSGQLCLRRSFRLALPAHVVKQALASPSPTIPGLLWAASHLACRCGRCRARSASPERFCDLRMVAATNGRRTVVLRCDYGHRLRCCFCLRGGGEQCALPA